MIDLFFGVLFLLMCFWGARKGVLGALAGLLGSLASYVGARLLVPVLAPRIAAYLQPLVDQTLKEAAAQQMGAAEEGIRFLLHSIHIPENLLEAAGSRLEGSGGEALEAAAQAVSQSLAPVIAFLAGFVLCKLAIWLLVRVVGGALPFVRTVNHGAGLCLGALGGIVMIVLLCLGLRSFAPTGMGDILSQESILESRVAAFVYQVFP